MRSRCFWPEVKFLFFKKVRDVFRAFAKKFPPFSKINNPIGFLWLFQVIHTTGYIKSIENSKKMFVDEKNGEKKVGKKNLQKPKILSFD